MSGLKLVFLSLVLAICMANFNADETPNKKLDVKIYYEALCSDSIRFMKDELRTSMSEKGRLDYTNLLFVPYGHVVFFIDPQTKEKNLYCQHGKKECELNAQHACIIENNTDREAYEMITCLMRAYNTDWQKCAEHLKINITAAMKCKETRTVADILEKYGNDTYALNPSFIPTITIDGVFDWDEQTALMSKFDEVFCSKYKAKYNETLADC